MHDKSPREESCRSVGRGRKVILEGGKRPGEERPFVGVNNVNVGERIRSMSGLCVARRVCHWTAQILGAAASPSRVMGNGRGDSTIREDLAAANGEKPLKGGCPWTIWHEIRPGDPRHGRSQER